MKTTCWLSKGINVLVVMALVLGHLTGPFTTVASAAPPPAAEKASHSTVTALAAATSATSSGKGQITVDGPFGVQVNTYNGNLFYQRTDLLFPTVLPLAVSLAYNSLLNAQVTSAGFYGWRFNYDIAYREEPNGIIVIVWGDGRQVRYTAQGNNAFAAPPGIYDMLTSPQPGQYVLTTANQFKYYFDSARHQRITRIEHPNGQALVFEYDVQDLLTHIAHSLGQQIQLHYTWIGETPRLTSVTDPDATPPRVVTYLYDDRGNLTGVIDALGETLYAYDEQHRLIRITGPDGNEATLQYDANSRVVGLFSALSVRYLAYDDVNHRTIVVDTVEGQQFKTTYTYDTHGRITRLENALGHIRAFTWDARDNPIRITDERGNTTTYTYNEQGKLLTATDALAQTMTFTYDPTFNLLTSITDARGDTTHFQYDAHGNLQKMTTPSGGVHTFTYNEQGLITAETNPLGQTFAYGYDAYGYRAVMTDTLGYVTRLTHDHQGNLLRLTDPNGNSTALTYDALGRPIATFDGLDQHTLFAYDASGNLTSKTDPRGNTYRYEYDAAGRLSQVIDPLGNVTTYTYNERGNLMSSRDALGRLTTFSYDALGRRIRMTDPLGHTTTYAYDAAHNLTRRVDANGQVTTYTYDAANRLTAVDYPNAADVSYTYDAVGNVVTQTTGALTVETAYNALAQPTQMSTSLHNKTVRYTYDVMGRRTAMIDPDGGTTTYAYTARHQLQSITNPAGQQVTFAYDPGGRLIRQTNANGTYAIYTYDQANRLQSLTNYKANGEVIAGYTYEYDTAGNRIRLTEADGRATTYTYDALDRLIGVAYPDGRTVQYTYDAVGNRLSAVDSAQGITTYTYDAANQLLTQQTPTQTITYNWDNTGNLVSKVDSAGTTTYAYDAENRLLDIVYPGGASEHFAYYPGADGLRLSRTTADGQITYFFYDGQNTLLETDANGVTVARYTAGLGMDEWLAVQRGGATYTYHRDGVGSITALTDATQAVAATYRYDVFGNPLGQTGHVVNPYRFAGRELELLSGLYYNRARYYEPATGRFLSQDPLAGALSWPVTQNRYPYAFNNPAGYTDPTGKVAPLVVVAVAVGVIIVGRWIWNLCDTAQSAAQSVADAQAAGQRYRDAIKSGDIEQILNARNDFVSKYTKAAGALGTLGASMPFTSAAGTPITSISDIVVAASVDLVANILNKIAEEQGVARKDLTVQNVLNALESGSLNKKEEAAILEYLLKPLNKAGNDKKDDTASVAGPQLPAAGATGVVTEYGVLWSREYELRMTNDESPLPVYRRSPRIALLWNGFAEEAAAFLNALGEPYDVLDVNFSPAVAALYPVLLIPSGGLYGLEGSASFRARLEAYAAQGGVILASTQQRGYEFSALPGGLSGYGWTEDQSCFDAAAYFPQYHQALSSFSQQYINGLVDGYFTTYPTNTVTLLTRDKNGYPAALLYPYPLTSPPSGGTKGGYVIATTLYADWGRSNYQYSQHDHRVWRDMLAWGTLLPESGTFPDFTPGGAVNVNVRLQNVSGQTATSARLILLNPDKGIVEQRTVAAAIAPGETLSVTFAATAGNALGIWAVDYILLDAVGTALQDQAIGTAFVVSNPHPTLGNTRAWDFWITAPSEDWVQGSVGEFTFHIHNRTAQDRSNVQVLYGFPHHTWEGGGPAYGNFDGLRYDVGTVPAGQEVTVTISQTMFTTDRLFGYLRDSSTNSFLAPSISFQIRHLPAAARVTLHPAQNTYWGADTITLNAAIHNLQTAAWEAVLRLQILNPQQQVVYQTTFPQPLPPNGQVNPVFTFTLPSPVTFGMHTARLEVLRGEASVGFAQASFNVPQPPLAVTAQGPAAYRLGEDNAVTFTLRNEGGTAIDAGTFNARLAAPSGATLWSVSTPFTLTGWQTGTLAYTLPFSTALGIYTLHYEARLHGNLLIRDRYAIPAAYAVSVQTDKDRYAGSETMAVNVNVQNIGAFEETLNTQLEVPDAPFTQSQNATPAPGATAVLSYTVLLTTAIDGGVHPFTVTLTTGAGASSAKAFQYIILPADLRLSLDNAAYTVGGALPVRLTNIGGGQTAYSGQLLLRDGDGRLAAVGITSGIIGSGATTSYPLALPDDLANGLYTLKATYYAHSTGQRVELTRIIAVGGLEAQLVAATDAPVYHSGDPITATAWLTNTGGYAVVNGRLRLEAISMLGVGPLAGIVQDGEEQRVPGARITLDDTATAWTNLAGEFRFESVSVGQHTFRVERVGYLTYTGTHFVVGPQAPLAFTLTPQPVAKLSGVVRASGGVTLVVGADVMLVASSPSSSLSQQHRRTGEDGTYAFANLTPGDYTLAVITPGFAPYTTTLTLNAGNNTHDAELTPYSAWRLPFAVPRLARPLFQNQKSTIHNPQSKVPGLASPARIPLLTDVGGTIITDTTWTLAGSPYVLTSDTVITGGVTLTVEPGVTVMGNNDVELKVLGHLTAVGTPAQPITFTSATNTGGGQWSGLVFDGGTGHLRHVTVRYGGQDNTALGSSIGSNIVARNITSGELRLEQSYLRNVYHYYADYGLYVTNSRVVVSDTLFASNGNGTGDYAFYAIGASTVVTITGGTFQNNAGRALGAADGAQVIARHSRIHDNGSYDAVQTDSIPLDARYNWWGQSPPSVGKFSGSVLYTPWIITGTFTGGYFDLADDDDEPNETFVQATLAEGINTELTAFLDPPGDVDSYRLEVGEPGILLALADARGTPLALRVRLYDVNESLLATFTGAAGALVTATAEIVPGVYFINVTGVGNADKTSSHLPYHLTLTLTDLRANLVADTSAQAGRTYNFGTFSVDLLPGASTTLAATAPPSLTTPGGYYLVGALENTRGQSLAESLSTFFISDSAVALTLHTDYAAYRPGQTVQVTGELHNTGASTVGPQAFTLTRNGVAFHTESVILPPYSVYPFTATTSAPGATGQFTLTGQMDAAVVTAILPVAAPAIAATFDAPAWQLDGAGPWEARLSLANQGLVAATVAVDFHGEAHALALLPGDLTVLTRTLAFTQTTTLVITLSGDVTQTLTQTVAVSAAPQLALAPADPQHEGEVIIPYTLVNPGAVELVAEVMFESAVSRQPSAISNQPSAISSQPTAALQQQGIAWITPSAIRHLPFAIHHSPLVVRAYILPAGGVVSDTLAVDLARGVQTVNATLRVDAAHNPGLFSHNPVDFWEQSTAASFTVKGDNDLRLNVSGAPTVAVAITNAGWNAFTGTLHALGQREATFSLNEQAIHVPTAAARTYTATVDTTNLAPGPYTVTLEVWTDDGALVATTALTGAVQSPDFVVTKVPAQTTLAGNQETVLVFGVENRGAAPDLAAFHLALGDLKDETQQQWIPAGATGWFTFTVYTPLDMPSLDVLSAYNVTSPLDPAGDSGRMVFHVDGVTLEVAAATDQPAYDESAPFTFTLTITNTGARATGDMTVLVAFNGITQTRALSLTAGQSRALAFPYQATFTGNRQLFYGVYGAQTDRGAYLNTRYLYQRHAAATVMLDRQVYAPGATLKATVLTPLTRGRLVAYAFGTAQAVAVRNGVTLSFAIPADAERGSHALYYVIYGSDTPADGREMAVWFDVAAPWARVIESRLGPLPTAPGERITVTLTIASDAARDLTVWAWLRYPDGSEGAPTAFPTHLEASLNNQATVSAVVTDTQMGLYQLLYRLQTPTSQARTAFAANAPVALAADGSETFDVGPAELMRASAVTLTYPNGNEPVRIVLEVYSAHGGATQVTLTSDVGATTNQAITLQPGLQTFTVTLAGPLAPGRRTARATLTMQGYYATRVAAFDYGAALPDLRPGAPSVAGSGLVTRTLTALVGNSGQSAAATTTAHFYDGDPAQGGTLIGSVAVPALAAGETTALTRVWDIAGKGGARTLYCVVAPVTEWDVTNNSAQSAAILPRLDAGLTVAPVSFLPGGVATFTTRLRNLQDAAALPTTFTLTVRSPLGTVVYSHTQTLTLNAGQERILSTSWTSGKDAQPGAYAVLQEAVAVTGERALTSGTFTVNAIEPQREWRIYVPLVMRNR